MTEKKPYKPTRTCPHRWCKPLHLAPLPFGLALLAFNLWHNLGFLVVIMAGALAGWWLPKAVHFKRRPRSQPPTIRDVIQDLRESPTAFDLEIEDAMYEGTGWRMLEVRKGWARVAVACDAVFLALVGLAAVSVFSDPAGAGREASEATIDGSLFITIGVTIVFIGFTLYVHKKATQPRKPKRAWVPAFLRTNI